MTVTFAVNTTTLSPSGNRGSGLKHSNRVAEVAQQNGVTTTTADTYDLNDRLINEVTTSTTGEDTTTTYQYGGTDNPGTEQTQVTTVSTPTGQLVDQENYSYNLPGQLSGAVIDKYNSSGNLAEQDTTTYTYNANGDRVGDTDEVQVADPHNPTSLDIQSDTSTTYLVADSNPTGYSQVIEQVTRNVQTNAVTTDLVYTLGRQITTQA